jgi:hypothetical protein
MTENPAEHSKDGIQPNWLPDFEAEIIQAIKHTRRKYFGNS